MTADPVPPHPTTATRRVADYVLYAAAEGPVWLRSKIEVGEEEGG